MNHEQPPIPDEISGDENEPLSPEAKEIASLKERRRKIEEIITPEKLEDEETRNNFEKELVDIDQKIDEVLEKAGVKKSTTLE